MKIFGKWLEKKSIHMTENYYIWQEEGEGASTEGLKKKVSGCQFFPFRHPLA
jgi:hypothetical protein